MRLCEDVDCGAYRDTYKLKIEYERKNVPPTAYSTLLWEIVTTLFSQHQATILPTVIISAKEIPPATKQLWMQ